MKVKGTWWVSYTKTAESFLKSASCGILKWVAWVAALSNWLISFLRKGRVMQILGDILSFLFCKFSKTDKNLKRYQNQFMNFIVLFKQVLSRFINKLYIKNLLDLLQSLARVSKSSKFMTQLHWNSWSDIADGLYVLKF